VLVDSELRIGREYGGVGFGISRKATKIEALVSVVNTVL